MKNDERLDYARTSLEEMNTEEDDETYKKLMIAIKDVAKKEYGANISKALDELIDDESCFLGNAIGILSEGMMKQAVLELYIDSVEEVR